MSKPFYIINLIVVLVCILSMLTCSVIFISGKISTTPYYKFTPNADLTAVELWKVLNAERSGDKTPPEGTERHFVVTKKEKGAKNGTSNYSI